MMVSGAAAFRLWASQDCVKCVIAGKAAAVRTRWSPDCRHRPGRDGQAALRSDRRLCDWFCG